MERSQRDRSYLKRGSFCSTQKNRAQCAKPGAARADPRSLLIGRSLRITALIIRGRAAGSMSPGAVAAGTSAAGRANFVDCKLSVAVLVELLERCGSIGEFAGVNYSVAVRV